jgi:hypothetical protein
LIDLILAILGRQMGLLWTRALSQWTLLDPQTASQSNRYSLKKLPAKGFIIFDLKWIDVRQRWPATNALKWTGA